MAKITATAETPTPIRPEAQYLLGREGTRLHVVIKAGGKNVTLCLPRKPVKADVKHTSKDDITCIKCKRSLAHQLEATG